MSRLKLVRDPRFQDHLTPDMHPETPARLAAIDRVLTGEREKLGFQELEPRQASEEDIARIHEPGYIEELSRKARLAEKGQTLVALDHETFMSPRTYEISKLAAGAAMVAIDALEESGSDSSFVAVRPPGHHALKDKAMGFCLFNNVAIAADYARRKLGARKIFIIDWDVHHGNGTQDIFYEDPSVFFTSIHQYPNWPPRSGWFKDDGAGEGKGFNLNIPMPKGSGDRGHLLAFDELVAPLCHEFDPDLILVSAGYDAHTRDPLAEQNISTIGFAMLSQRIADLRDRLGVKVVCLLEGGYDTQALAESAVATMRVLNSEAPSELASVHSDYIADAVTGGSPVTGDRTPDSVDTRINEIKGHFRQFWKCF
ncbi:MAG: histone deacetylase [Candidatus Obscuribacterales bacterium]